MKLAARTALRALVAVVAVPAALLPFSVAAYATATPPAPNHALLGTWTNKNAKTHNVADIVVTHKGGGIVVDGFGACSPTPCEWGNIPGTVFGAKVHSAMGSSLRANWNFGFSRTLLLATLTRPRGIPTLVVKEFTTFIPPDGRANYAVSEKFVRAKHHIAPTVNGTAATSYPLGDWVKPAHSLLGTWKNTSPTGGGVKKIVLARNPDGSLSVHAFGNCSPKPCNWGVIKGITFGASVTSVSGRVFLAQYKFAFKRDLLSGSLNRAGTTLTIHGNSEFTDHSGRSNYIITDTFKRA